MWCLVVYVLAVVPLVRGEILSIESYGGECVGRVCVCHVS